MHLVMVDANGLLKDRHLTSPLLQQLKALIADHPGRARAAVTEVVIAEAVAKHHRDVDEHKHAFDEVATKKNMVARALGREAIEAARAALDEQCAGYEQQLREKLASIGFEVLGYPDVAHDELVARAVQRRPPNKANTGDGYRDTLNWFSVMHEAAQLRHDDEVVWVSEDKDFADNGELHPVLSDELDRRDIDCRVRLIKTVDDAIDHVQAQVDPENRATARVRAKLRPQKIAEFIQEHLLQELDQAGVTPRQLALPLNAQNSRIEARFDPDTEPEITVAGAVEGGVRIRASWDIPVLIAYTEFFIDEPEKEGASDLREGRKEESVRKDVTVTADLVTDRNGAPRSGEIVRIEATHDDSGRKVWASSPFYSPTLQAAIQALWKTTVLPDLHRQNVELMQPYMPKISVDLPKIWDNAGYGRLSNQVSQGLNRLVGQMMTEAMQSHSEGRDRSMDEGDESTTDDNPSGKDGPNS